MNVPNVIGIGVYSVPQASRLTRVSPSRIRRWLRGYEYQHGDDRRRSAPVWRAQLPQEEGAIALGFLDLMEIRFVDAFAESGLSLRKIRRAVKLAADLVGTDHPLSTQKFRTDGKRIFAELEHETRGDKALIDIERNQLEIYDVILPSLLEGVEFDNEGQATRWRPDPAALPMIMIDPHRQFGQPIVIEGGIQTAVLADAVRAEGGSIDAVARWYEVPKAAVEQAVLFEFKKAA
jgi:uncharacterized protein (DUF433 family)/DNA-binding transcriptional MerR regulator